MNHLYPFSNSVDWSPRFLSKIVQRESGCIEWTGCLKWSGYGKITVAKVRRSAPQAACFLVNGIWPKPGEYTLHSCDNRLCVNPAHLRLGSHQENIEDTRQRKRWANGESHGMNKYSKNQILQVVSLHNSGTRNFVISRQTGIPQQIICNILKGRAWSHLTNIPDTTKRKAP